jgi:hypothetical protein
MARSANLGERLAWSLPAIAIGLQALLQGTARADEAPATTAPSATPPAPPTQPPEPSPDRPVPDYRGRPPPPTTAGEVLLWVPRVVLSPLYFVSEYVLRRPLSVLVPAAEKIDLPRKVYDFFTFGEEHKAGWVPTAYVEFAFNPSVGVYAWWNDAGFEGNHLHAHFEAWPSEWIGGNIVQRIDFKSRDSLQIRFEGVTRPDKVFYGIGPSTLQSNQSRYEIFQLEGNVGYEWHYWRASRIQAMVGARHVNTSNGSYGSDPSLTQEAATGAFPIPFGFEMPYTPVYSRIIASLDSRVANNRPAAGAVIEAGAEQDGDVQNTAEWIRWGANAGAYADLNGYGRILGISVATEFVDPLGSDQVPFTELVYLGGEHPLTGFYDGRLRDRSAITAAASYAWPIGPWLDGALELDIGNVFDQHLSGFNTNLLRLSAAFGLDVVTSRDKPFQQAPVQLLVGFATETFQQGTNVDAVRVTFGVPTAF